MDILSRFLPNWGINPAWVDDIILGGAGIRSSSRLSALARIASLRPLTLLQRQIRAKVGPVVNRGKPRPKPRARAKAKAKPLAKAKPRAKATPGKAKPRARAKAKAKPRAKGKPRAKAKGKPKPAPGKAPIADHAALDYEFDEDDGGPLDRDEKAEALAAIDLDLLRTPFQGLVESGVVAIGREGRFARDSIDFRIRMDFLNQFEAWANKGADWLEAHPRIGADGVPPIIPVGALGQKYYLNPVLPLAEMRYNRRIANFHTTVSGLRDNPTSVVGMLDAIPATIDLAADWVTMARSCFYMWYSIQRALKYWNSPNDSWDLICVIDRVYFLDADGREHSTGMSFYMDNRHRWIEELPAPLQRVVTNLMTPDGVHGDRHRWRWNAARTVLETVARENEGAVPGSGNLAGPRMNRFQPAYILRRGLDFATVILGIILTRISIQESYNMINREDFVDNVTADVLAAFRTHPTLDTPENREAINRIAVIQDEKAETYWTLKGIKMAFWKSTYDDNMFIGVLTSRELVGLSTSNNFREYFCLYDALQAHFGTHIQRLNGRPGLLPDLANWLYERNNKHIPTYRYLRALGQTYGLCVCLFDQFGKIMYPGFYTTRNNLFHSQSQKIIGDSHAHRWRVYLILAGQHIYLPDQKEYAQHYSQRLKLLSLLCRAAGDTEEWLLREIVNGYSYSNTAKPFNLVLDYLNLLSHPKYRPKIDKTLANTGPFVSLHQEDVMAFDLSDDEDDDSKLDPNVNPLDPEERKFLIDGIEAIDRYTLKTTHQDDTPLEFQDRHVSYGIYENMVAKEVNQISNAFYKKRIDQLAAGSRDLYVYTTDAKVLHNNTNPYIAYDFENGWIINPEKDYEATSYLVSYQICYSTSHDQSDGDIKKEIGKAVCLDGKQITSDKDLISLFVRDLEAAHEYFFSDICSQILLVYGYYASRYDTNFVLYLTEKYSYNDEKGFRKYPFGSFTDVLKTGSKIISATFQSPQGRTFEFRDPWLLCPGLSLDAAFKTYATPKHRDNLQGISKGIFPYRYLVAASVPALIEKLTKPLTLEYCKSTEFQSYFDWYKGCSGKELQCWHEDESIEQRRERLCKKNRTAYNELLEFIEHQCLSGTLVMKDYIEMYGYQDARLLFYLLGGLNKQLRDNIDGNIQSCLTIGSTARRCWLSTLPSRIVRIPKIHTINEYYFVHASVMGGPALPLGRIHVNLDAPQYARDSKNQIVCFDVVSLYPAAAMHGFFPYFRSINDLKWWSSESKEAFPMMSDGWVAVSYEHLSKNCDDFIVFDHVNDLLTRQKKGNAVWPMNLYRFYMKYTVASGAAVENCLLSITPLFGLFVHFGEKWKPFDAYMERFMKIKCEADVKKKEAQEAKDEAKVIYYEGVRTLMKMFANNLIGVLAMSIQKPDNNILRTHNDVIGYLTSEFSYNVALDFLCEQNESKEATYLARSYGSTFLGRMNKLDILHYLPSYVYAYAKIIMQEAFTFLRRNPNCDLLYTDTDSIYFSASPTFIEQFENKFSSPVKKVGSFDRESYCQGPNRIREFICLGPKKRAIRVLNMETKETKWYWVASGIIPNQVQEINIINAVFKKCINNPTVNTTIPKKTISRDLKERCLMVYQETLMKVRQLSSKYSIQNGRVHYHGCLCQAVPSNQDDDVSSSVAIPASSSHDSFSDVKDPLMDEAKRQGGVVTISSSQTHIENLIPNPTQTQRGTVTSAPTVSVSHATLDEPSESSLALLNDSMVREIFQPRPPAYFETKTRPLPSEVLTIQREVQVLVDESNMDHQEDDQEEEQNEVVLLEEADEEVDPDWDHDWDFEQDRWQVRDHDHDQEDD